MLSAMGERKLYKLKMSEKYPLPIVSEDRIINLATLHIKYGSARKINFDEIIDKFAEVSEPKTIMSQALPICR